MSGKVFIAVEPRGKCETCGKFDELRPYGLNNERICFECSRKNPEITEKKIRQYIFDEKEH